MKRSDLMKPRRKGEPMSATEASLRCEKCAATRAALRVAVKFLKDTKAHRDSVNGIKTDWRDWPNIGRIYHSDAEKAVEALKQIARLRRGSK